MLRAGKRFPGRGAASVLFFALAACSGYERAEPEWERDPVKIPVDPSFLKRLELALFEKNGESFALLSFFLGRAHIISLKEGREVARFRYGRADEDFRPSHFSFCPELRLLACGDFEHRRLRVLSVDTVVFQAHFNTERWRPGGGLWYNDDVLFVGKTHLIARATAAGRGLFFSIPTVSLTEVYEAASWRRIWFTRSPDVSRVTLSRDGKPLAFLRDDPIEIGRLADARRPE